MKSFITLTFLLACLNAWSQVDSRKQEIVFQSVNVIPMDSERLLENQDVVIREGKIIAMAPAGKAKYSSGALLVNGKGKYLMPGLAEMHAHIPQTDDLTSMKEVLMLFAVNGVTAIRGMLGHPKHLELRAKIKSGEILGPRFYTSGPSFNGNSVKTPEGGAAMVREQKDLGYDFLKFHPGMTLANFNAVVKTAKEVNITFAGHVSADVGVWRSIDAGYATIDHLDGFIEGMVPGIESMTPQEVGFFGVFAAKKSDAAQIPKLMKQLHDHNTWVVPTQCLAERWISPDRSPEDLQKAPEMIYMDAKTVENWVTSKKQQMSNPLYNRDEVNNFIALRKRLILECQKNGVGLLLGSDAPQVFNVPGFSIHHELRYMVDAGLTPYEALRTGTVNVAAFYKADNAGTIKTGNVSDLVLLNGNPLKDIGQSGNVEGVMLGNLWLPKEYMAGELKKLKKQ